MPLDSLDVPQEILDPYSARVSHAFETVGPAVVHILAHSQRGGGTGSGVIFAPDGYLLTKQPRRLRSVEAQRQPSDGRTFDATLIGDDPRPISPCSGSGRDFPMRNSAARAGCGVGQLVVRSANPLGFCRLTGSRLVRRSGHLRTVAGVLIAANSRPTSPLWQFRRSLCGQCSPCDASCAQISTAELTMRFERPRARSRLEPLGAD